VSGVRRIRRLLVANRGEIARRIFRTCRRLGIETAAVYADQDRDAPHPREADVAVALGGRTPAETYLASERLITAAKDVGADALHPGYGFLAENADFARAVTEAGLAWVGPSPGSIAVMGDKVRAKRLVSQSGVPTLPGQEIDGLSADALARAAAAVGLPALIKAAGGGGGRGMRLVREARALPEVAASARREAAAAFGNDRLFVERYLESPRHVEVQILGDRHGHVVHLFERECSIQRRHQKIIEEAPSPAVTADLRARLTAAALAAARAIGYESAGTVEFLLDGDGAFYFLEVNTRLQVEHPVTEAVTGVDLVREQIRVAEGCALPFRQGDVSLQGHAVEARVYAEDPANGFLPTGGRLLDWRPSLDVDVRVDSGVEAGTRIAAEFDPMLAKLIAHAPTREEAALRLALALTRLVAPGVVTNRDLLVNVLRHPRFLAGDTTTDFLERHRPAPRRTPTDDELRVAALAAALTAQAARRAEARALRTIPSGWRNNPSGLQEVRYRAGGREVVVGYLRQPDGGFRVRLDGVETSARLLAVAASAVELEVDGRRRRFHVTPGEMGEVFVQDAQGELRLEELPRFPAPAASEVSVGGYTAPVPGKVLDVRVAVGDKVARDQPLVTLEAMKMEHQLIATADGVVAEVRVSPGQQVDAGQMLVVIAPQGDDANR
jgi:propionyl-CoA carboxylase alpha chain